MTSKRSLPDVGAFPENQCSNKRRIIDPSVEDTSNSPDGHDSDFGEFGDAVDVYLPSAPINCNFFI